MHHFYDFWDEKVIFWPNIVRTQKYKANKEAAVENFENSESNDDALHWYFNRQIDKPWDRLLEVEECIEKEFYKWRIHHATWCKFHYWLIHVRLIYDSFSWLIIYDSSFMTHHLWLIIFDSSFLTHHFWLIIYDSSFLIKNFIKISRKLKKLLNQKNLLMLCGAMVWVWPIWSNYLKNMPENARKRVFHCWTVSRFVIFRALRTHFREFLGMFWNC